MNLDIQKFNQTVEAAKAKTDNKRWITAIDKAAAALLNNKWIVTELFYCLAVTTESGETYRANGETCQCRSFFHSNPCRHRAAYRLIQMMEAASNVAPRRAPQVTRSVESDHKGFKSTVVRCDGWAI